jgi:hypothetical protein
MNEMIVFILAAKLCRTLSSPATKTMTAANVSRAMIPRISAIQDWLAEVSWYGFSENWFFQ